MIGLDADVSALRQAKVYARDVEKCVSSWICGDVCCLPLKDQSFSLILSLGVIEHLKSRQQQSLLREVCRVLRPKGFLLLSTPNKGNLFHTFWRCYSYFRRTWAFGYERSYYSTELAEMVQQAGLRLLGAMSFGHYMCAKEILGSIEHAAPRRIYASLFHILLKLFAFANFGFHSAIIADKAEE
jgi:ubiquinone/menaquinone biosynthesis C-methylase UbiE